LERIMQQSVSLSVSPDLASARWWPQGWWKIVDLRIGIVPVPIYLILIALVAGFSYTGDIKGEISIMIAVLVIGGFTCAELGKRTPMLRNVGAAAIFATFIPSAMAYYKLLPPQLEKSVVEFTKYTNFLYLFIACIIVGSILGMDRKVLVQGFLKIFVPLAAGSIAAGIVGTLVGTLLGLGASHLLFRGDSDHGRRRRRGCDPALGRLFGNSRTTPGRHVRPRPAAGDARQPHRHPPRRHAQLCRQALSEPDRRRPAAAR
jgi:hypothetical protein